MVVFPNAKINLGLKVTEKRNDGFHNLETCFYPVLWKDALEVIESTKTQFTSTGIEVPGKVEDNLCVKAYKILAKDYSLPPVAMHLHKSIPIGAGLGGGSSDASFALKAINEVFNLFLDPEILMQYAAELGSDCPFFVENKPVLARGKGNIFEPINLDLSAYFVIIVFPGIHVSTAGAFSKISPSEPKINLKEVLENTSPEMWKNYLVNDFEESVFADFPQIAKIKDTLYKSGALFSSMSGSGSAVFGIFDKKPQLESDLFAGYIIWEGKL
ncbi:MAG: 4-(cytidine 5'-diphospho)-2-C-methyl-D-erythritol kinase [Bacteroidota bacterium]|nr:4-(cytidine 5'-diphospho)-2-C-methyl-D-erythritol kinase [Bacteroidota bacterium]